MPPLLRRPDFRAFVLARVCSALARGGLAVVLGYHLYALTGDPLDLGWMGLAEAVPSIGLVLYGGHVADRHSRMRLTALAFAAQGALAAVLAAGAGGGHAAGLILGTAALRGAVRAFGEPASTGLEAQVVPGADAVRGVSLLGSAGRAATLAGPALLGGLYAVAGPGPSYAAVAALFLAAAALLWAGVPDRKPPEHASTGGALAAMLATARHPPRAHAGTALLLSVTGFGLATIAFGLSRDLGLSLVLLAGMGAADSVSMVVRQAILRLVAAERMRGRVAAVRSVFLNSANELGDFESGVAASCWGRCRRCGWAAW